MTNNRQAMGQVLIETALAAVGIVVMAYLVVRAGQWLNQSMVDRNASFQGSRRIAGGGGLGVVGFSGPAADINLINGPGPERTGGLPVQGPGPSASPPACSAAATTYLTDAATARSNIATDWTAATTLRQTVMDESNKAADLITGTAGLGCGGRNLVCTGDQCKGANWYWCEADRLQQLDQQITNLQRQIASLQAQIATLEYWIGVVTLCCGAGDQACCDQLPGMYAQLANLQAQLANAQAQLAAAIAQREALCAAVMTGNSWVGGRPASCTPPALRIYATQVRNYAYGVVAPPIPPMIDPLRVMAQRIQFNIGEAEELEGRGRAECASGRDP